MKFCLEEKLAELKKPTVKNKMNWSIEVYKDSTQSTPEMNFDLCSNTEFKLITAVAVVAAAVAVTCAVHKLCRLFSK